MLLRPRQKLFVERSLAALHTHKNTLGVAFTGFGKTFALSGLIGLWLNDQEGKACVLAHRDELTTQNERKFRRVNPGLSTSIFDANEKSWAGQTTFAMVQTLSRDANLKQMPAIDLLVINEAHHAAAVSYRRIIDAVRERNSNAAIYGVTATPNRGDRKGLRAVFSNVADHITLAELIQSGHLVPPVTKAIDVGTQDALVNVDRLGDDFDMVAVAAIMNKAPITEAVIRHWREHAGDRKTVVFCSTVDHARNVTEAFCRAGIATELIHGDMTKTERKAALLRYESGASQVVVNVAVLTEGWDFPPTSCVVLLRPSSYKSTLIQMIGRGLRTVDQNEFPGVIKTDCIVLDFGISTRLHGSLEQDVNLEGNESLGGRAPQKRCPECAASVPAGCRECSLCGFEWQRAANDDDDESPLTDFVMTDIDLLKRSSFRWCDLFGDDAAWMATGFDAWAGFFFLDGQWYGVGGTKRGVVQLLCAGERTLCFAAANDWLNARESEDTALKSRTWLSQAATPQQPRYLPAHYAQDFGLSRYHASCLLAFLFNKHEIKTQVFRVANKEAA